VNKCVVIAFGEHELEDGVQIPSDEDELAAGASKGFNEDEFAEGV
jgi:hypothetical protein